MQMSDMRVDGWSLASGGVVFLKKDFNFMHSVVSFPLALYDDGDGNVNVTMSKKSSLSIHVRYTFRYIPSPSSVKRQREMTKFKVFLENVSKRWCKVYTPPSVPVQFLDSSATMRKFTSWMIKKY